MTKVDVQGVKASALPPQTCINFCYSNTISSIIPYITAKRGNNKPQACSQYQGPVSITVMQIDTEGEMEREREKPHTQLEERENDSTSIFLKMLSRFEVLQLHSLPSSMS